MRVELMGWEDARNDASRIRFIVFVEEQRVPKEMEIDDFDARSLHALAYSPLGEAVATGRLLPDGHIGRMAVLKEWRSKGAGSAVLRCLIGTAQRRGDSEVWLSAQSHAVPFYRKHGFAEEGAVYEDAGIPHQAMRKALRT